MISVVACCHATNFAHTPLGISARNKMVLWPGCGGLAEFSLYTKNVRSVWFVVKRRGCCCNLSGGIALIVWFTTNGMCVKNKNICAWREQAIIREIATHDLCCCLLPGCEALRTCRSRFPIATKWLAMRWFQSIRPYSWATGRNSIYSIFSDRHSSKNCNF